MQYICMCSHNNYNIVNVEYAIVYIENLGREALKFTESAKLALNEQGKTQTNKN